MLPIFQTDDRDLSLMQTKWASEINPLLKHPLSSGLILEDVALISGVTVVNHLLQRKQQGWFIVDQNAAAAIYRSSPFNNLTLSLTSDAAVTVNIFVF